MEYSLIIKKAIENDEQAWNELYKITSKSVYFTAYNMLRNKEDALDIMQSSYITAFNNLNQLKEPLHFNAWLKKIAINKCKNMLKSKKAYLFQTGEKETFILNNIEEQCKDFLPEEYIINETKRKQIMDIINRLPEVQKITIFLFYYQDLSIKEISNVMECSDSTVTSRISYAKKYIRREIERLEQNGDKLYAITPVLFIKKLLDEESKIHNIPLSDSELVWQQIISASSKSTMANLQSNIISSKQNIITKLIRRFSDLNTTAKYAVIGITSITMVATVVTPFVLGIKGSDTSKQIEDMSVSNSTTIPVSDTKVLSTKSKLGVLVNKAYDDAGYFRDEVCPVNIHGKWGIIDKHGNLIVKPQWDYMSLCSQDGYLMVGNYLEEIDGGYYVECGFIDTKGNTVIPMQKSVVDIAVVQIINAKYLGNDTFSIDTYDHGMVYYDKNGKKVKPVKNEYRPELDYIQIKENSGDEYQYGIADKDGNVIIKPQYSKAFSIGNGFFVVNEGGVEREAMQGGTWKIINEKNVTIKELGEYGCYYVQGESGYGWGESFPIHTPLGVFIIGAVKEENTKAQSLIDRYLNINNIEFESIKSSSILGPESSFNYEPKNVQDGNDLTAWVEGAPDNGEGQWIKFSRSTDSTIKTVFISNGYCKDDSTYNENGRVKEMKLEFSDGTSQVVKFPDSMYEYVIINLPKEVKASFVKCTILSVYPGEKYSDTCINEISFLGDNSIKSETETTQGLNKTPSTPQMNGEQKMYDAYYKILQERINQYGILPTYEYDGANSTVELLNSTGVAYAALLDFEGNGTEELFICYNSTESKSSNYIEADSPCMYEIWGYNGSSYLLAKERAVVFGGGNSLWGNLYIYKLDKNIYVVNSLIQKDSDEEGAFSYRHDIYGTITNGKWAKKELEKNSRDNITVPWENIQPIISFDELTYTDEDKENIIAFIQKLKKYSK